MDLKKTQGCFGYVVKRDSCLHVLASFPPLFFRLYFAFLLLFVLFISRGHDPIFELKSGFERHLVLVKPCCPATWQISASEGATAYLLYFPSLSHVDELHSSYLLLNMSSYSE